MRVCFASPASTSTRHHRPEKGCQFGSPVCMCPYTSQRFLQIPTTPTPTTPMHTPMPMAVGPAVTRAGRCWWGWRCLAGASTTPAGTRGILAVGRWCCPAWVAAEAARPTQRADPGICPSSDSLRRPSHATSPSSASRCRHCHTVLCPPQTPPSGAYSRQRSLP